MSDRISANVQCPFFVMIGASTITCEGLIKKTTAKHSFKSKKHLQVHTSTYCCDFDNYHNCVHCRTLEDLYERGTRK
jgi:hypothetical protein